MGSARRLVDPRVPEIHESDMLLIPDAATAFVDPVLEVPTMDVICDIYDPITGNPTRPATWRKAERTSSRRASPTSPTGGGGRVLSLERRALRRNHQLPVLPRGQPRGLVEQRQWVERPQLGRPDPGQARLLSRAAGGHPPGRALAHHPEPARGRRAGGGPPPRGGDGGADGDRRALWAAGAAGGHDDGVQVHRQERGQGLRPDGDVHAKPLFGDNGSGMRAPEPVEGRHERVLRRGGVRQALTDGALLYRGLLAHAPALLALAAPTTNSYRRLVPGTRRR